LYSVAGHVDEERLSRWQWWSICLLLIFNDQQIFCRNIGWTHALASSCTYSLIQSGCFSWCKTTSHQHSYQAHTSSAGRLLFWVVLFPKSLIRLKHYEIQLVMWLGFSNEVFLSLYLHCCLLLISGQWACVISSASSQSRFGWVRYHSQF